MSGGVLAVAIALLALAALVSYWLVVVTEAAYLGPRAVVWLYDRGASTYDAAKGFDRHDEAAEIANPLLERLAGPLIDGGPGASTVHARVLDVAAGTGRVAVSLLSMPDFDGSVVCLDLSRGMLEQAARKTEGWRERCPVLLHPATPLPFADRAFDAVTLLEALEFLPDRQAMLREAARVLVSGGWLLVANRTGVDRWLLPRRVDPPTVLVRRLEGLGFGGIAVRPWLPYYDLVWARKAGEGAGPPGGPAGETWRHALRCPACGTDGDWESGGDRMACRRCGASVRRESGVWVMAGP